MNSVVKDCMGNACMSYCDSSDSMIPDIYIMYQEMKIYLDRMKWLMTAIYNDNDM